MRCDLRTRGECACAPDECRASPTATTAPTVSFTMRDQLVAICFGFLVYACVFVAMGAWNEQLRTQALVNQENVHADRN